jgi:nitrite reductase (NO-forming)
MKRFEASFTAGFAALALLASGCSGSGGGNAVSPPAVTASVSDAPASLALPPQPTPELLPPLVQAGVVHVDLVLLDRLVTIAPGIRYRAWTFNGTVPGPVIHARVGDTIDVTLTNRAIMGHSIDFHAALAPANVAYQTVQPGKTLHFSWVVEYPGVFMYHCGTPPVLAHISNGMYGAIIIDPKDGWGSDATSFVFVQSEFYPSLYPGTKDEYYGDLSKMKGAPPQVVTFNGRAFRYRDQPLVIRAGQPVRVFIVNAGPSHFSAFHVVGTILTRVLVDGNPANAMVGLQTAPIPPGGGAVIELTTHQAGTYPIVTHSFGDADAGALGIFKATD